MKLFFNSSSFSEDKFLNHLPEKIFSILKQKELTNGNLQQFLLNDEQSQKISVKAAVTFAPAKDNAPDLVELKFEFEEENSSLHYYFSDKNWFLTATIENNVDYLCGNKKACPVMGLSDEQCQAKTEEITHTVVTIISQLELQPTHAVIFS